MDNANCLWFGRFGQIALAGLVTGCLIDPLSRDPTQLCPSRISRSANRWRVSTFTNSGCRLCLQAWSPTGFRRTNRSSPKPVTPLTMSGPTHKPLGCTRSARCGKDPPRKAALSNVQLQRCPIEPSESMAGVTFLNEVITSEKLPTKEMLDCMRHCCECAGLCGQCAAHCLFLAGKHASASHQGLLHDCVEMCWLVECFMARASDHSSHVCRECTEICNLCSVACDELGHGDALMTKCAKACRSCATACEAVLATSA